MAAPQVFGLVFAVVCGIGMIGSAEKLVRRWAVLRRARPADGVVVRVDEDHDAEHGISRYRPVVQYVPEADGVEELRIEKTFAKGRWTKGDRVPVLYDPRNPAFAVWAEGRWAGGVVAGAVLCSLGTGVGAVLYFFYRPPNVN